MLLYKKPDISKECNKFSQILEFVLRRSYPLEFFFQYYCLRFQFASSETVTLSLGISFCNFLQARISVALYMYATGVGLANMCVFVVFFVLLLFFFSGLDILAINWETVSVSSVLNIICSFS